MARRLVSTMVRMKGGPTLGGSGTRVTVYDDEALTVVSTLYQRAAGAGQQPNALPTSGGPHLTPNAGKQTTLRTATLVGDTVLNVVSIAGFAVGDLVPIYDGTDTVFRVITALNAVGPTMTVDSAVGVAFATADTFVNRPSMRGHVWFWVDDALDYFIQPYDVAAAELMPPMLLPTLVPSAAIDVEDEGVEIVSSALRVNFVGDGVAVTDAGGGEATVTVRSDRYNMLSNPGFEVWQRGAGPFTADGAYAADRWLLDEVGTDTLSVTQETVDVDADSGSSLEAVFVLGSGAGATFIGQKAAATADLIGYGVRGRTISFRLRVRTATPNAVRAAINTNGTGGTTTYSSFHTGGGGWESLDVTVAVPADATEVNVRAYFAASCTAQLDNGTLVIGSTGQTYYPLHSAEEWERCQRYYELHGPVESGDSANTAPMRRGNGGAGLLESIPLIFMVKKATAPTVTKNGTWTVANCDQPSIEGASRHGYAVLVSVTAAGAFAFRPTATDHYVSAEANP